MTTQVEHATSLRCPVCRGKVVVALQDEVVIHNAIIKVDFQDGVMDDHLVLELHEHLRLETGQRKAGSWT